VKCKKLVLCVASDRSNARSLAYDRRPEISRKRAPARRDAAAIRHRRRRASRSAKPALAARERRNVLENGDKILEEGK
jgi:hypothetical protein